MSFVGNERYLGEQATTQIRTNMANTIAQVKRLLGRKFSEPGVAAEFEHHLNFKAQPVGDDEIGIQVNYNDEKHVFSPTQVLAMFFTKCKEIIATKNPHVVTADVVVSVPGNFTDRQRQAVRDAASIAGLNCLRVLNEGTAAALSYGIFKSAKKLFPEGMETKVMFLDMGYGHFSATVAAFTNGSLRILASETDDSIGARELDNAIARYFADEFKAKTGIDAWSDRKARLKLLVAAEKAKTTITPFGVNTAQVGVECLKDDRDFSGSLTLEKLEELSAPFLARMQDVIRRAMAASKTASVADLAAVELVGGGMRPRPVKRRAAEVLGMPLNEETGHGLGTSMNLDEAVSRGCALACAMLSPVFRVVPFDITDTVNTPVRVSWDPAPAGAGAGAAEGGAGADPGMDVDEHGEQSAGAGGATSMTLFRVGDPSPVTRRITFRRGGAFELTAELESGEGDAAAGHAVPAGHPRLLGRYHVSGIPADAAEPGAPAPRVRIDFRHDINGIFSVVKAELLREIKEEKKEEAPAPAAQGAEAAAPAAEGAAAEGAAPTADGAAPAEGAAPAPAPAADGAAQAGGAGGEAPKKKRFKRVELTVTLANASTIAGGMTADSLSAATALEARMAAQDADIHATHDMRNSLEAYIYATRDALLESLAPFGSDEEKSTLGAVLESAETWLYDNMEAGKATFADKLAELRQQGDRLTRRRTEEEARPAAVSALLASIEEFRAVLNNRDGKHGHLTDADRDVLRSRLAAAEDWLRSKQEEQGRLPCHVDPVLTVSDITGKRDALVKELRPIATRPPPAPAAAPAAAPAQPAPAADGQQQAGSEGAAAPEMPVDADAAQAPAAAEGDAQAPEAAPAQEGKEMATD